MLPFRCSYCGTATKRIVKTNDGKKALHSDCEKIYNIKLTEKLKEKA